MSATTDDRRIGTVELEKRTATNRSTLWRWYTSEPPRFPRPHYLGTRRLWWLSEILAWEAERLERPAPPSLERLRPTAGAAQAPATEATP